MSGPHDWAKEDKEMLERNISPTPWAYEQACRALEKWRAEAARLAVKVEDLEHEVGTLKEKLRRIWGYINSVVPHGDVDGEKP